MKDQATIKIPNDLLAPAIEAQVTASLVEALGTKEQLLTRIAREFCKKKVDSNGKPTDSNYSTTSTMLEYLTEMALRKAVEDAIGEWIAKNQAKIRKAVTARLKADDKMANAMCDGFMAALTGQISYGFRVMVQKNED